MNETIILLALLFLTGGVGMAVGAIVTLVGSRKTAV